MRLSSSFVFALAISLSCITTTTPSFSDVKCSISNDFFDATPAGDKKCYPGKKDSPTGNMQWELRTFEKGNFWAISALTIVDGDFVLNKPSNIKDAFGNYNWVTEKNPNFQKMAKSTVKTNVFQKFTRVYSATLGNWADDCFAFISFKKAGNDDGQRPNGAFRAVVCNKANTGFSDELMDEISMRFNISNSLHKGNKFKYWKYQENKPEMKLSETSNSSSSEEKRIDGDKTSFLQAVDKDEFPNYWAVDFSINEKTDSTLAASKSTYRELKHFITKGIVVLENDVCDVDLRVSTRSKLGTFELECGKNYSATGAYEPINDTEGGKGFGQDNRNRKINFTLQKYPGGKSAGKEEFMKILTAIENKTKSTSKLDKAKSTCTELGFTLGTEKHGECVLKMMDK